jgi:V/A-type H+-transporting ATPase subunit I
MKKVTALVPADALPSFTASLHKRAVLHLTKVGEELPDSYRPSAKPEDGAHDKVAKLEQVMAFCESYGAAKKSFVESLVSSRTVARTTELEAAARRINPNALHSEVGELRARHDTLLQRMASVEKETERLRAFAGVAVPLDALLHLRHIHVALVRLGNRAQEELERACPETIVYERLAGDLFWVAFPREDESAAEAFIESLGPAREEIPAVESTARERLASLAAEKHKLLVELSELDAECRAFAQGGNEVELALGYWQSEMHRADGLEKVLHSDRIGVVHGYLPAVHLESFSRDVRAQFGGEVLSEDPKPGDRVPVKVSLRGFFRPVRLLVDMFGVPDYFSIDPTPFLTFTFLAFFGICFSDVVYGLGLIALSAILMRKFRQQESLRYFFQLFLYCGVSTCVFGALIGSWAGDLFKYFGEGNVLQRFAQSLTVLDPLSDPITALLCAVFIGVANQYFGISMLIWRNWRRGDRKGALYDGGLWYLYLTGIVILCSGMFATLPGVLKGVGACLLVLGAIGLVLTQGRDQETLAGRVIFGVVSLYGILGSYGATGFVGDTLSYTRLLALGLTTGIVGMSFNILADIAAGLPYIGLIMFVVILIFGHTFNFFMSIIGSFVHPARLILLEFFGRFYEPGGIRYEPFGFRSERVEAITGGGE